MDTVAIGMSGGVDSSVAAFLLKEEGYRVFGFTLELVPEDTGCKSPVQDAKNVCEQLGIPHEVIDLRQEFKAKIMSPFISEYLAGRTPNPCVECNKHIKWGSALKKCISLGADYIATGHYARILQLPNGRYTIGRGRDLSKDQSYVLYSLGQYELAHAMTPLSDLCKSEVREIAEKKGLSVSKKPDSQESCFIPDNDHLGFIERQIGHGFEPGNFVDKEGKILGTHKGIACYTIGQRRGLGLSLGTHVYVTEIRPDTNEVVIGSNEDVFRDRLNCRCLNFMSEEPLPI